MHSSVVAALSESPLGAGFTDAELTALAGRLPHVDLAPGQALFEAGAPADAAYVLLQGELAIYASDGTFLDRELPGALVGEQALLPGGGGARNAAIRATERSQLLRVEAQLFSELTRARAGRLRQIEEASDDKTRNRLSRLSGPLARLLAAGQRRTWSEGEAIFEEGDDSDGLHLILSGRAEVVAAQGGEPVHLATVYPGRVFGEIGALRGTPRTAAVVARAGLRTAFVPAADALELQRAHPDLEDFLSSLLRSYALPRRGALHQRWVFRDGQACVETVYALTDGRELTALRVPGGRYHLTQRGAEVAKRLEIAPGTTVSLDAEHRVVGLEDAGQYDDIAGLQSLALDGEPLPIKQRRALRRAAREAALEAPDALICRCLHLERATLQESIDAGARTPEVLQQATGVGTVCGGCMRKAVPAMLAATSAGPVKEAAAGPSSRPSALPAPTPKRLPQMPRLIPWLGNFSFSRDPAGFQRRGHARLGPVFGAHLMGVDFVFIDPVERPELLAGVLTAPAEELSAAAAWRTLVGGLLGELVDVGPPDLSLRALPPSADEAATRAIAARLRVDGPVDLLALSSEAVTEVLCALRPPPGDAPPAALATLLERIGGDLTAFGALNPLKTPSDRRRVEARRSAEALVGAEALAWLVASHRNAQLAVVAALLELLAKPEALAATRAALDAAPRGPWGLEALRGLTAVHSALDEGLRLHGGGGVWRQATRSLALDGAAVPEGALVGLVIDPAQRGRGATPSAQGAFFDEGFGSRGPAEAAPEAAAALVLARLLNGWDWELAKGPKRWSLPIVPGMQRPVGALGVVAAARSAPGRQG